MLLAARPKTQQQHWRSLWNAVVENDGVDGKKGTAAPPPSKRAPTTAAAAPVRASAGDASARSKSDRASAAQASSGAAMAHRADADTDADAPPPPRRPPTWAQTRSPEIDEAEGEFGCAPPRSPTTHTPQRGTRRGEKGGKERPLRADIAFDLDDKEDDVEANNLSSSAGRRAEPLQQSSHRRPE